MKSNKTGELQARHVAYLYMAGKTIEADQHLMSLAQQQPAMLQELKDYYPEIKSNLLFIDLTSDRSI